MKCIEKLVNEVYNSCKIPFQLIMHDVGEYSTPQFEIAQNEVNKRFIYNNTECCIKINAAFSVSGAYVFGGQLGFISSVVDNHGVLIYMTSKIIAGVLAITFVMIFDKLKKNNFKIND